MVDNMIGQPQSVQVPNYSGVNIQIFNPSVAAPGGALAPQNVSAPSYATNPSYPPNYYMQNYNPIQNNVGTPVDSVASVAPVTPAPQLQAVAPAETEKKKTEKREIVQLTDDYIKNVENYLNNQDPEIRLLGAKEVLARFQEDPKRKDDQALNALVNKMLQDPSAKVKFISMAILDARLATGDPLTVKLLQNIQQQKTGYGQDALKASTILLKMSGQTVQKEFEVKDKPKKEEKKESEKA